MRRREEISTFRAVSKPAIVPGARATLLLSLAMSFIGVTGVVNAYSAVTTSATEIEAAVAEQGSNPWSDLLVAQLRSPVMKGVHVANLLASGLLIIASVLLTGRRRSALWWTRQSLVANLLYTLAYTGGMIWFASEHTALIDAFFESQGQTEFAESRMLVFGMGTSCGAVLLLGLYAVLLRVSTREDIRGFVNREPA